MVILLVVVALINISNEASKKFRDNFKSLVGISVEKVSAGFSLHSLAYCYFGPANKKRIQVRSTTRVTTGGLIAFLRWIDFWWHQGQAPRVARLSRPWPRQKY
jgi:hypothetical protein